MNVALWAEIRRLSEIEKLSGRAIAHRLRCSWRTVALALKLEQPPARTVRPCASPSYGVREKFRLFSAENRRKSKFDGPSLPFWPCSTDFTY